MDQNYILTDADYKELCSLVYHHTGIALTEEKRKLAYSRFSKRIKALKLDSFKEYCHLIKTNNAQELKNFTNAITTNLTSFYREMHHFERLNEVIIPELKLKENRKIRIWSAGCSTGEEAYSIAMTLLNNFIDINGWDIRILATDLDTQVLDTASKGVYPANRLEGIDNHIKEKWFKPINNSGDFYKVDSRLRSLIAFKHLNLMNDQWPMKGPFDLVFCRNVVIYFDKNTQEKLFKKFSKLQDEGDHLIVGHSESLKGITDQYKHVGRTSYVRV